MLNRCFTCLDDSPIYPVVPRATFVPNEQTWVAESSDFFYGLEQAPRPRWGRMQPPPPWCPDPVGRPGRGFQGPWPQEYPPAKTDFMRMQAPAWPPVELGEDPVERTPAQKVAVAVIGGALVWWLIANASKFTTVPERRY